MAVCSKYALVAAACFESQLLIYGGLSSLARHVLTAQHWFVLCQISGETQAVC